MTCTIGTAVVADDDPFFRIALSAILKERVGAASVVEVGSLDEALEVLADVPDVGLALFDLAMPGMAGAASLAAVRECFPEVTTVVVSGSTRREDVILALQAGVHGFVPKAEGVDDLVRALTAIVEGWIYVPPFVARIPLPAAGAETVPAVPPCSVEPAAKGQLTPRQSQILELIVDGRSNKEMARSLGLSEGTVKVHVAALLRSLGVQNRAAAAAWGARRQRD